MISATHVVAEQRRRLVRIDDQNVDIAVVIKVAERHAATRMWFGDGRTGLVEQLLELPAAQVPEQYVWRFVWRIGDLRFHFGIDHSGGEEQVGKTVVVQVHDPGAPAYIASLHP